MSFKITIGSTVRYIGGQSIYKNAALYLLIGRTGIVRSKSQVKGMDWFVEMDFGCYDIDVKTEFLEKINPDESDKLLGECISYENSEKMMNERFCEL